MKHKTDSNFSKYPPQPIVSCEGFEMEIKKESIKNVLFDLGKVLYEIDIARVIRNFNAMIPEGKDVLEFSMEGQPEMFTLLETGQIEEAAFAAGMIEAFQLTGTHADVRKAWDSILVGIIPGRVEALQLLATNYHVGILSNTNAIHFETLASELVELFEPIPKEHQFLSYQMGLRKPLPEIYQEVLRRTGWKAEETLFMDDGISNCKTAKDLGFKVIWFEKEADFGRLMKVLK